MELGNVLKSLRKDRGYSLRDLAQRSGYSQRYIWDIESGRRLPKIFALDCILSALSAREKKPEVLAVYWDDKIRAAC
jgi:transcriptional regulator with XRE-family HTH domain